MIKSCYIHIPFCETICSYCDFSKMYYNSSLVNRYLNSLKKEIQDTYQGEELETIYIGGGTPSCLSLEQLKELFEILKILKKKKNIEYTIEGNIESTSIEKLKIYKEYGINRLSFGIESINPNIQKYLNRKTKKETIENLLQEARNLGFHNINLDLMYAIPNETMEILKDDLEYILSLEVEHISTYSLMIEKNTVLNLQKAANINQDLDAEMYEMIEQYLKKRNYNHYEISNFSKKGKQSKHNTTYWNNEEYYGFGLGASSYRKNQRIENTRSITQYLNNNYQKRIESLTKEDKIEYEIILNLRKKEGINLTLFEKKYKKPLQDYYSYEELIKQKLLIREENHLFIPEDKWYISNEIIVKLLERRKNYE